MSHAVCEVVIPPTDDVAKSIEQVMKPFDEDHDEDGYRSPHAFWDFYVIGGRWSGNKLMARFDKEKLDAFYAIMDERKVTVSGLQCGKQELSPASQIPMVDELWREHFPGAGDKCLLFNHATDQYGKHGIYSHDICTVAEVPFRLDCERLIVAGPHWDKEKHPNEIKAARMLCSGYWNGCDWQKTDFNGNVKDALTAMMNPSEENKRKMHSCPLASDWLVVTVDYHS